MRLPLTTWLQFTILSLALQACASVNPIAQAETTEQRAYAVYGTYVIMQEQAAVLVSSGDLPNSAVLAIADADERAQPVLDSLLLTYREYLSVKAEFDAGRAEQGTLLTVLENVNSWIERAVPLVNNLTAAVEGAQ